MAQALKKKIFINISDIASYIGQNKWDYVTPFERIWKKCDKECYEEIMKKSQNEIETHNIELKTLENNKIQLQEDLKNKKITSKEFLSKNTEIEKKSTNIKETVKNVISRIEDIHLNKQEKLEKIVDKSMIDDIKSAKIDTNVKKSKLSEIISSNKTLTIKEKEELQKAGESFINTTHGTLKEDDAIKMYEKKYKVKLDTSQAYFKKKLDFIQDSKYEWYIGGKLDGLYIDSENASNSYVVEVKNRTKAFFSSLRDYEKTQIQLYMWMVDLKQARLVEKKDAKIRNTKIYYDDDYINDIINYLQIFINNFEKDFLNNYDVKYQYIYKTQESKKIYLNQLYLSPIVNYINSKILESDLDQSEDETNCNIE